MLMQALAETARVPLGSTKPALTAAAKLLPFINIWNPAGDGIVLFSL